MKKKYFKIMGNQAFKTVFTYIEENVKSTGLNVKNLSEEAISFVPLIVWPSQMLKSLLGKISYLIVLI